jgi:outer membrane protein TolC
MGMDAATPIELSDSLAVPVDGVIPTEEDIYNEAKDKRPDFKAVLLQQSLNDQQIKLASAGTKPYVSLVGQYLIQTQSSQFNYFKAFYPSTPYIGAQLNVPIFNGFSNTAKIKRAQIAKQQSIIQADNAGEQLRIQSKQVVADLHETLARLQTRVTVKQAAQLSYDITQYRYAKGVASRLELTDAELALTTAQSNYLEAVYDYLTVQITLDKTVGLVIK